MRWAIFPLLLACSPERAAEEPRTAAALAALGRRAPIDPQSLALRPGPVPGVAQLGVMVTTLESEEGLEASLRDLRTVRLDTDGNQITAVNTVLELRDERPRQDGRICWWIDGVSYQGWRSRPPRRLAHGPRCDDAAAEGIASLVAMFADRLVVVESTPVRVAGRAAVRLRFTLRGGSTAFPDPLPRTWPQGVDEALPVEAPREALLRRHGVPQAFAGALVRDEATGALLAGSMQARFALRKDGRPVTLAHRARVVATTEAGPVRAPANARAARVRARAASPPPRDIDAPLPGPGDAPPLRLGPDESTEVSR